VATTAVVTPANRIPPRIVATLLMSRLWVTRDARVKRPRGVIEAGFLVHVWNKEPGFISLGFL
jgi:hypothetical protein